MRVCIIYVREKEARSHEFERRYMGGIRGRNRKNYVILF